MEQKLNQNILEKELKQPERLIRQHSHLLPQEQNKMHYQSLNLRQLQFTQDQFQQQKSCMPLTQDQRRAEMQAGVKIAQFQQLQDQKRAELLAKGPNSIQNPLFLNANLLRQQAQSQTVNALRYNSLHQSLSQYQFYQMPPHLQQMQQQQAQPQTVNALRQNNVKLFSSQQKYQQMQSHQQQMQQLQAQSQRFNDLRQNKKFTSQYKFQQMPPHLQQMQQQQAQSQTVNDLRQNNLQRFPSQQKFQSMHAHIQQNSNYNQNSNYDEGKERQKANNDFADDEPIMRKDKNAQELEMAKARVYNLEKGIELRILSQFRSVNLSSTKDQIVPVMISLRTSARQQQPSVLSNEEEQKKGEHQEPEREGIDLVCALDTSGSMHGEKIVLLKKTLEYLLTLMGAHDRLCLIQFNDRAVRLHPLLCMTEANKDRVLTQFIKNLNADGENDIGDAMRMAFQVLAQRKFKNSVSSVFLLSDGLEIGAEANVRKFLMQSNLEENISINTFGFGSDHDANMMREIAKLRDGNFYYIEQLDLLDEYFTDAFGGLLSVIAQNVHIELRLNRDNPNVQTHPQINFIKQIFIARSFGSTVKPQPDGSFLITINQLFEGVSKDFIFEMVVPKQANLKLKDIEKSMPVLTASLSAESVDKKQQCYKNSELNVTFQNEGDIQLVNEDNDVEMNYLRVRSADVMATATRLADQQQYVQAQKQLHKMIKILEEADSRLHSLVLQLLIADLRSSLQSCSPQEYEQRGKTYMASRSFQHMEQKSSIPLGRDSQSSNVYQNALQSSMTSYVRSSKI